LNAKKDRIIGLIWARDEDASEGMAVTTQNIASVLGITRTTLVANYCGPGGCPPQKSSGDTFRNFLGRQSVEVAPIYPQLPGVQQQSIVSNAACEAKCNELDARINAMESQIAKWHHLEGSISDNQAAIQGNDVKMGGIVEGVESKISEKVEEAGGNIVSRAKDAVILWAKGLFPQLGFFGISAIGIALGLFWKFFLQKRLDLNKDGTVTISELSQVLMGAPVAGYETIKMAWDKRDGDIDHNYKTKDIVNQPFPLDPRHPLYAQWAANFPQIAQPLQPIVQVAPPVQVAPQPVAPVAPIVPTPPTP
jgi:hypothetical protein